MPLYLVRWPNLTASLVRAVSETELLDVLDEVASPGECTWSVYRGPLWVDFDVPVRYRIVPRQPGRLRREEVVVEDVSALDEHVLVPRWPEYSDTAYETRTAILSAAFPSIERALDATRDEIETATLAAAVTADLVAHGETVLHRGVTFDDDLRLLTTRTLCFRRTRRGFAELDALVFEDFCCGLLREVPDTEGYVRVVTVEIAYRDTRVVSARLGIALRLRADGDGVIDPLHRADAYASDDPPGSVIARFGARRNAAVQWQLDARERRSLARVVNARVGRVVLPAKDPT